MLGFWRKTSAHGRKKLAASSKLNSPCGGTSWGIFLKMTWSWYTFTSGGRPPAWVSNLICTCFGQCFEEKHSFRRNYICYISLDCRCKKWCFVVGLLITSGQWAKNLRFFGKRFRQLHQKCILRLAGKKSKKKLFSFSKKHNVIFCLGYSARKILVMDEKFMVALLELLSTCLANMSKILDKLNIFSQLSGFEQKDVGVLVQIFPQDCRNYIIRVQKIILRKSLLYGRIIFPKLFLDQECKLFALLKFFSRQNFQTWMHIVQKNTWRKKFLGKKL